MYMIFQDTFNRMTSELQLKPYQLKKYNVIMVVILRKAPLVEI